MFPFRKKKEFFSPAEKEKIVQAIRNAEMRTSGEIRVFIESRCRFMDAMDRALEIFANLKMEQTEFRNAVLLYIALKDHQLAVYGDKGIHERVGTEFWDTEVIKILAHFNGEDYAGGISNCVTEIGESLQQHFPYDKEVDKNELPDEIIFGK
ncbi:MAG: TPM domain-containing protein [Ginsengibacter sp.]